MMETDVRDYLLANSDISTLIVDGSTGEARIYASVLPATFNSSIPAGVLGFNGLPAITYQRIHTPRFHKLDDGPATLPHPILQINAHASTAILSWELGDLIRTTLDGFQGTMGATEISNIQCQDERDMGFEIEVRAYRRELDFRIFYSD